MIALTDEMRTAFETAITDGAVPLVASATASGAPDIAFKGSALVLDEDHLAFWERSLGQTLRNIQENPQVCVLYRNPVTRTSWKFFGEAEVHGPGAVRDRVRAGTIQLELDRDPEDKGVAVVITVTRVVQGAQIIMARDPR